MKTDLRPAACKLCVYKYTCCILSPTPNGNIDYYEVFAGHS